MVATTARCQSPICAALRLQFRDRQLGLSSMDDLWIRVQNEGCLRAWQASAKNARHRGRALDKVPTLIDEEVLKVTVERDAVVPGKSRQYHEKPAEPRVAKVVDHLHPADDATSRFATVRIGFHPRLDPAEDIR